jgi:DNA-binding TFAR19-related protein (PDSD5 family)
MEAEDKELELLKAKRFAKMTKEFQDKSKVQEKPKVKTPREIMLEHLIDRGDEVLEKAEKLYPEEMKIFEGKVAELITARQIKEKITGGQLLYLLRALGLKVPMETKIGFYEDGKLISFQEKISKSMRED